MAPGPTETETNGDSYAYLIAQTPPQASNLPVQTLLTLDPSTTSLIAQNLLETPHVRHLQSQPTESIEPQSAWRAVIAQIATRNGTDPEIAVRISWCESGFNPSARNKSSTASGLFQWLDSSFARYAKKYGLPLDKKNDPYVQIELSTRVLADGGIGNWSESKFCWSK